MGVHFTRDHEWVRIEGETATIGITDYAQKQLGDVVYVELPAVGASVKQGEQAGVVESVKAASEVYAPVSGEVISVNDALANEPGRVNSDPMGAGWFFKVRLDDAAEAENLLGARAYQDYLETLA